MEEHLSDDAFDLSTTHVHLGLGATAQPIRNFSWTPEFVDRYSVEHESDGIDGRLVMIGINAASWDFWERHPAGEELVVVIEGKATLIQEIEGEEHRIALVAGQGAINPTGVWHSADVTEPTRILYVTPGLGTEDRSRP